MKKILIGSINENAGKTSVVVGLMAGMKKQYGYMKPLGDRLLYRKKRLWDYDSALVTGIFNLSESPEDMSIGFEHSKLRFMYDETSMRQKLNDVANLNGAKKDILLIEGGKEITYGSSVGLDVVTVAKDLGAKLVLVISGNDDEIVDEIRFLKKYIDLKGVDFGGFILNKVLDVEDFKNTFLPDILKLGVKVHGMIPKTPDLEHCTTRYLSDVLFTKVIAGEAGLDKTIKHVFVGAMSASAAMRVPHYNEDGKLLITSGDRADMILTAFETNASGVLITNNIVPPSNIISKAEEKKIPLLLIATDTFKSAKQIDDLIPLITKNDSDKIKLISKLVTDHVDVNALIS